MINGKLQNLRDLGYFYIKNIALDLGFLAGHSDYCRFIILSRGRSGSNFLRGLLNSHSQIITFGELFRFYESIGWEFPFYDRYLQSRNLISLIQKDPIRFLEKKVFRKYLRQISAVGFKMFYYHAQDDSRKIVWTFLKNQKDLRVIHLKRRNTLRMILSEKKAFRTDRWTNITGEDDEKFSISIDYEECLHRFAQEEEFKKQHDFYFQDHFKIDVIYEDLADDYASKIKEIQEFLGVNYEAVKPSTYKQSNQPLLEAITNYFELKGKFKGTPWEEFFEG